MPLLLVLFASLIGSVHCAAMCGGFVSLCTQSPSPARSQAAYHIGRLMTYLLLGGAAGYLGHTLNGLGGQFGITHLATILTGALLILAGISGLLRLNVYLLKSDLFHQLRSLQQRLLPDRSRILLYPLSIGICSTFLPCGWLYSYVAVAGGTASIVDGMAVMFAFWLGTVPILAAIGSLSNLIVSPISKYVPLLASLLLICAGAYSIQSHLISAECHTDHHHQITPGP